jgi:hypothetical protein
LLKLFFVGLTLASQWKSQFDDSEETDNEWKQENLQSPEHRGHPREVGYFFHNFLGNIYATSKLMKGESKQHLTLIMTKLFGASLYELFSVILQFLIIEWRRFTNQLMPLSYLLSSIQTI